MGMQYVRFIKASCELRQPLARQARDQIQVHMRAPAGNQPAHLPGQISHVRPAAHLVQCDFIHRLQTDFKLKQAGGSRFYQG